MKEEVYAPDCGRENELIAFLYGELDPEETIIFRSHMQECQSCSAELREFTGIRESVVAWRNEALGGVALPAVQPSTVARADLAQPGALTALREFFNLSPTWLKGAVVFASLLFCLFAVLAATRLRDTTTTPSAANSNDKTRTEKELNAIVERRVQDELQRIKSSERLTSTPPVIATGPSDRIVRKRITNRVSELASTSTQQKARRPLTKVERQQLAADLRLIDNASDGELDLLDDRINQ